MIANSDAARREKEAVAEKVAVAAERIQTAKAKEESYLAEQAAEVMRAERDRATQIADTIVPSPDRQASHRDRSGSRCRTAAARSQGTR